ncbi:hypothetical protein L3Q82_024561, partial [Scortum barcoo]
EPHKTDQLLKLQACLKDIKAWMTRNFLLLNSDKTEVILLGPKHLRNTLSPMIALLDGINWASRHHLHVTAGAPVLFVLSSLAGSSVILVVVHLSEVHWSWWGHDLCLCCGEKVEWPRAPYEDI